MQVQQESIAQLEKERDNGKLKNHDLNVELKKVKARHEQLLYDSNKKNMHEIDEFLKHSQDI